MIRQLSNFEIEYVQGGMSDTTQHCMEYGAIGATEGAFIGAILAFPFYAILAHPYFISSSARVLGILLFGTSISAGILIGGVFGTASGFITK